VSADPGQLRSVPSPPAGLVTARGSLVHRCPFVEEVDAGEVLVTWVCEGSTVELHSLAKYLATWANQRVSHEEVTAQIAVDVGGLEGIGSVVVETKWTTAGLAVTVRA
jgi:NADPH-dependent 7-cyano-7-deazaguanine reductase QueF